MKLLISLALIFVITQGFSQSPDVNTSSTVYYSDDPILNIILERTKDRDDHYSATFPYSSCNLFLYKDGSFVFYYVDVEVYKLARGTYIRKQDLYIIHSDSAATAKAITDPEFYKKYFKFKAPVALEIKLAAFFRDKELLIPFHNSQSKNKIELFRKSGDFSKSRLKMAVFKDIHYDLKGKRIVVEYDELNEKIFPMDSIWGYKIFKRGLLQAYRTTPKGFNWYGIPGILIVQTEPFIIYTVGEERLYSYFSRDLNSKIYPLDFINIKREFRENKAFTNSVEKEFGAHKFLSVKGSTPGSYRILELYKECLQKN